MINERHSDFLAVILEVLHKEGNMKKVLSSYNETERLHTFSNCIHMWVMIFSQLLVSYYRYLYR